jgi:murein DD-endopeptidase MepM/ murein hydrolase activator NlpD
VRRCAGLIVCGALLAPLPGVSGTGHTPPPPVAASDVGRFRLSAQPRQGALVQGHVPAETVRLVVDGRDIAFAEDGRFILGFGRDYQLTTTITAFFADGRSLAETLAVARTAWRVESLPTVRRYPQPSAEFQARRPGELAQIAAARRARPMAQGWRQRFIWPARGRVSGVFGSQRIYAGEPGAPHNGVDVTGAVGTPVVAPADGVVTLAASLPFTLEGNLVLLDHGLGLDSAFLHLSRIDVRVGDVVRQGQSIGAIGATGRASGPHLHWGVRWNDERLDPQMVAGPMR